MIFDQVLNTENNEYFEMDIVEPITSESMNLKDATGMKIWHDRDYVFVSSSLKDALSEMDDLNELKFTLGYSYFAS